MRFIFLSLLLLLEVSLTFGQNKFVQVGIATYYADKFEGRKTTSGEKYSKFKFSAAHSSLPIGTYIRVTNIANNKSIVVRVNDRCAKRITRVVDLSKKAAKEIGIVGTASVKVETIDTITPTFATNEKYFIRVVVCYNNQLVDKTIKTLSEDHQKASNIVACQYQNTKYYKILVGPYKNEDEANLNLKILKKQYKTSYVIKLDNSFYQLAKN